MSKLIGTNPNQVPTNADLGTMAYMDYDAVAPVLIGGRRNLIINGAMEVWQRGTSHSAGGGIVYTADRFWRYGGTSGTIERSTDVPSGFNYSLYWNCTAAGALGTSYELPRQGHNPFYYDGQLTYSFYIKGDFSSSACYIKWREAAGSDANYVLVDSFSINTNASEWQRVSFTIDATGIGANPTNKMLCLEFAGFPAGGKITGVQLELGSTATPFEHRSYGEELALCQRYYQITNNPYSTWGNSAGYASWCVDFATEMRASPTVTAYQANGVFFSGPIVTSRGIDVLLQSQNTGSAHKLGYNCDAEL